MAIELNVGNKSNIGIQTADASTDLQASTLQYSAKILGGESLKVSSGEVSDLEKLVARLKTETDDTKMSVTQRRISILQTVLNSISDHITETERENLIKIEELNGEKAEAETELCGYETEKTATEGRIVELDVKIAELENAIERAVQEGEDHRKQVEELKKQRNDEQEKLDQLETSIKSVNSKISGIDVKIAECTKTIAQTTLNEVANALRIATNDKPPSASSEISKESDADRVKKEKKEEATSIAAIISAALDKIDDQIRKTLDEVQMRVKG